MVRASSAWFFAFMRLSALLVSFHTAVGIELAPKELPRDDSQQCSRAHAEHLRQQIRDIEEKKEDLQQQLQTCDGVQKSSEEDSAPRHNRGFFEWSWVLWAIGGGIVYIFGCTMQAAVPPSDKCASPPKPGRTLHGKSDWSRPNASLLNLDRDFTTIDADECGQDWPSQTTCCDTSDSDHDLSGPHEIGESMPSNTEYQAESDVAATQILSGFQAADGDAICADDAPPGLLPSWFPTDFSPFRPPPGLEPPASANADDKMEDSAEPQQEEDASKDNVDETEHDGTIQDELLEHEEEEEEEAERHPTAEISSELKTEDSNASIAEATEKSAQIDLKKHSKAQLKKESKKASRAKETIASTTPAKPLFVGQSPSPSQKILQKNIKPEKASKNTRPIRAPARQTKNQDSVSAFTSFQQLARKTTAAIPQRVLAACVLMTIALFGKFAYEPKPVLPADCIVFGKNDGRAKLVQVVQEPRPPMLEFPRVALYGRCITKAYMSTVQAYYHSASDWYFIKSDIIEKVEIQHHSERPLTLSKNIFDEKKIVKFLENRITPNVGYLSDTTYEYYIGWQHGLVWSLFDTEALGGNDVANAKYRPMLTELSAKFRKNFFFTYMDTEINRDWIQSELGIVDFPAIVVQKSAGDGRYFVHKGEMTTSAISQFLQDVNDGCLGYECVKGWKKPKANLHCDALYTGEDFLRDGNYDLPDDEETGFDLLS